MKEFPGEIKVRIFFETDVNEEQLAWLKREFPKNYNKVIAAAMGVSVRTLSRLARKYGLKKSEKYKKKMHEEVAAHVKKVCSENGYYASLKGIKPSKACMDAHKRWVESGHSPLGEMKKNSPERFAEFCRESSRRVYGKQDEQRRQQKYGVKTKTHYHLPEYVYTKAQRSFRHRMKAKGYILGDIRDSCGERYTIYWDGETERSVMMEKRAPSIGFGIVELRD